MTSNTSDFLSIECVDALNLTQFGNGQPCILGIDAAGRGPVLGPMVYGCAMVLADKEGELRPMGVNDSKALSVRKRTKVFEWMQQSEFVSYSLRVVHPRVISVQMQRRMKQSMNDISHDCAVELIRRALAAGICIKEVFVDLVGQKEDIYQQFLLSHFPSLKITVSKRADSIFPVVGAASIAAKVVRDWRVAEWQFEEKGFMTPASGLGSGYPSDPLTKRYITEQVDPVFGFPSLVRFSWKTVEKVLQKRAHKCEWNYSSAVADGPKQTTLMQLWTAVATKTEEKTEEDKPVKRFRRHVFFSARGLANVQQLD